MSTSSFLFHLGQLKTPGDNAKIAGVQKVTSCDFGKGGDRADAGLTKVMFYCHDNPHNTVMHAIETNATLK